jgi:hypothetical protein
MQSLRFGGWPKLLPKAPAHIGQGPMAAVPRNLSDGGGQVFGFSSPAAGDKPAAASTSPQLVLPTHSTRWRFCPTRFIRRHRRWRVQPTLVGCQINAFGSDFVTRTSPNRPSADLGLRQPAGGHRPGAATQLCSTSATRQHTLDGCAVTAGSLNRSNRAHRRPLVCADRGVRVASGQSQASSRALLSG